MRLVEAQEQAKIVANHTGERMVVVMVDERWDYAAYPVELLPAPGLRPVGEYVLPEVH